VAKQPAADKRPRRERGSINADEIVNGAFELAEQVSIDNLSMPLLAKHLGVGVTSIYWYFRKKDDLLDEMTERALRRYHFATPFVDADNWRVSLQKHAREMREAFRTNPVLSDLVLIRGILGRAASETATREVEQAICSLVVAGLTPQHAFDTYAAVALHTRSSVILERLADKKKPAAGPPGRGGETPIIDRETMPVIDRQTMPIISELAGKGHRIGAADDINFQYGLTAILDHAGGLIEERSAAARRSSKARKGG
jgi:AcrR family transcriptional regulator